MVFLWCSFLVFLWKVMRFEPPTVTTPRLFPRATTATPRRLVPGLLQPLLRIAHGFPVLSIATVPAYRWPEDDEKWQKPKTAPCIIYIYIYNYYITISHHNVYVYIYIHITYINLYIIYVIYIYYTHISKSSYTSCRTVSTWNNKGFPVKRGNHRIGNRPKQVVFQKPKGLEQVGSSWSIPKIWHQWIG